MNNEMAEQPAAKLKIKHDWYQTESQVIITIMLKDAVSDMIRVQYGKTSLSVSYPIPDSDSEYSLELELAHEIEPTMCTFVVSSSKVEVKLVKVNPLHWINLEGEVAKDNNNKAIPQAIIDAAGPVMAPPYPFGKPYGKDWDVIVKDIKNEEKEEKPKGDEAIAELFKKIYGRGSDDVRRAMNKSFMESGGTVLSTSWKKVQGKKVKMSPPEGIEFKKWDA